MSDRVWAAMFEPLPDGWWEMRCPTPDRAEVAAKQGRALALALAQHPQRPVFCTSPDPAGAWVEQVLAAAGLVRLGRSLRLIREVDPAPAAPWDRLRVSRASEIGYSRFEGLLAAIQANSRDWPERLAATDLTGRLAMLRQMAGHRPDWWFLAEDADGPLGIALFDEQGAKVRFDFLGVPTARRGHGCASRLFRGALGALPCKVIEAEVDERNTTSRAMVASWGFTQTGSEWVWHRPVPSSRP